MPILYWNYKTNILNCDVEVKKIEIDNSFELACKYIEWINQPYVTSAFEWITEEEWDENTKNYLESLKESKRYEYNPNSFHRMYKQSFRIILWKDTLKNELSI